MAKRAAQDEPAYNPIDQALVNAATGPVATEERPAPQARSAPLQAAPVPQQPTQAPAPADTEPSLTRPAAQPTPATCRS